MFCESRIASKIISQGGEYVLAVKDNKPRLKKAIAQATAAEEAALSPSSRDARLCRNFQHG
jgi:predicted transposase YbfD/YdcC